MSAAPVPTPPPEAPDERAAPGDADGWALLESLRRRIDDQAAQGRKTQQQVTQLAESIGALVELQRRRAKWLNLNSFVAYLVFTMLLGAGFYFLYQSRAHELVAARERAARERDVAVRRADETTVKLAARAQADTAAWEVYELLAAGKRGEATVKLETLRDLPLSRTERAVLAARAHETQVMEVDAALKAAAATFKAGRHAEVVAPLEAALVGEPDGPRAASMHYYLGVAYAKLGQLDKAIAHLAPALAGEAEHVDARFQLASALDRSGAYAKARAEYDRFATAHPQSHLAVFAMRRSATLARMPAQAPAPKAAPATPVAPTATAPAPTLPAPTTPAAPTRTAPAPTTPAAPKRTAPAPTPPAAPKVPAPKPAAGAASSTVPGTPDPASSTPAPAP